MPSNHNTIDDQIDLCRAYAERQGWVVVETFHDAGQTPEGLDDE